MKLFWMILAGIVVAALFLLRRDFDKAFVIAALGMVAWFLNYRSQLKATVAAADPDDKNKRGEEEDGEDWNDN